ncbi:MAG: hypothetical protein NC548_04395 [Lachnospiraceae bacterium]|nr:hypothetical protein [Lachnospiraceae bacterium]
MESTLATLIEKLWQFTKGKRGVWKKVYEFPKNTIRYIRGIKYDDYNGRYIIATGDVEFGVQTRTLKKFSQ